MQQVINALKKANIDNILLNEPLAPYTTWKVGGPADLLVIPESKEQLVETVKVLHTLQVPWTTIGRGSNLLIADRGIRGVVVKLGNGLEHLHVDGNMIIAGAAYSFIKLSVMAGKHGLTGLEYAGGIPGTVGGAVYMNAGAHGSDVSRILKSAEVLLETGELVQKSKEELQYAYRHSSLHNVPWVVTEAVFELESGDRKEIAAAMASNKDRRLRTQPLQMACAGSVFRNPEGDFSARLIEQAGLKGLRVGGAEVSNQHANFIVNTGQASAQDILTLIRRVQAIVKETFGIELKPEVLMVGEW